MESGAGFAGCDFWCESHIESVSVGEIAYDPFRQHKLVGGFGRGHGQKFDFILFVVVSVEHKITHFGVAVFDAGACPGYVAHAQSAEIIELGEWRRLVISALVAGREVMLFGSDYVIFQFAHRVKFKTCRLGEFSACVAQSHLRSACQRFSVFVEKGA